LIAPRPPHQRHRHVPAEHQLEVRARAGNIERVSGAAGFASMMAFPQIPLSRDGVEYLLRKHVAAAAENCPSLKGKRISPHVLRHTAAMDLLRHGVDRSVIALWLGHETLGTVDVYVRANLQMKEETLAKTAPLEAPMKRYRPDDELLAFLKGL